MSFLLSFLNTFDFRPYREKQNRLSNYCPWSYFAGGFNEGIVLLKSGALMRTYSVVFPDLGSASTETIHNISFLFNESVKRLDNNWCLHFEAQRRLTKEYPRAKWTNIAGFFIDRRREDIFSSQKEHFAVAFYLTLTCRLKNDIYAKTKGILYKKQNKKNKSNDDYFNMDIIRKEINAFREASNSCVSALASRTLVEPLNNDEVATFIHSTISSNNHPVITPRRHMLFDHYLTDSDLDIGTCLRLGDYYIPIIAIRDFPNETYPAIFHILNAAHVEYRWVTRWIAKNKTEAAKDIEKYQKRFYASRKSFGTIMAETVASFESGREDPAAVEFEADTNGAKIELAKDLFSFGYYTGNIMVWDKNYDTALDKAHYVIGLVNSTGFNAKIETVNSFNAFLGMQPGNAFANVRRPIVSSGNLSHIVPLSSIWPGLRHNDWTKECFDCAAPLLTCSTSSSTPFFLNLNVNDVGHAFIFGPSGAGKSTLLCLLESQFLKYRNANIVVFDKDKTARSIVMAAGGSYIEPGTGGLVFQPLRHLETASDMSWAAEFIACLCETQGVPVDADMNQAVVSALKLLRDTKSPELRTLSTFQLYCTYTDKDGRNPLKSAVQPYTLSGQYASLFDSEVKDIALSRVVMIEMGALMNMGAGAVTPALMYLFRLIEKIYTAPDGGPKDGPTLLVLDEAWVFLDNNFFARKIEEWLVTLRKKHVFCVFATQEVAKAARSRISTTIVSQCLTKIYLADPSAETEVIAEYYKLFGLEPNEIAALSRAQMKKDYYYKSPRGSRMFELCLDPFQLALLSPDHRLLDKLEEKYGHNSGKPLAREILDAKGIPYKQYLS